MADIYSPVPASSQIFTSKSRPPFGQSMRLGTRHNQLPPAAVPLQPPLKVTQKRRHQDDSDDDMERRSQSPSPEKRVIAPARSRKLLMKKARVDADNASADKQDNSKTSEGDVDLADARVLLANLPLSSYPAMVQALLDKEPSITKLLISVIPRPSAEAAREAIVEATKQLRDAIPYSAAQSAAATTTRSLYAGVGGRAGAFGSNAASSTSSALGLTSGTDGFGALSLNTGTSGVDYGFGFGSPVPSTFSQGGAGQRDAYVLSRLRPAIQSFVSTVHAYLPYFSMIPAPVSLSSLNNKLAPTKSEETKPHPDEAFTVLATLTNSILSLPSKVVAALNEQSTLPERLIKEWKAWVDELDKSVNGTGEMYSRDQASSWINALDSFAMGNTVASSTAPGFGSSFAYSGSAGFGFGGSSSYASSGWGVSGSSGVGGWGSGAPSSNNLSNNSTSATHNLPDLKNVRDEWVKRVGWLVGRQPPVLGFEAMDEL